MRIRSRGFAFNTDNMKKSILTLAMAAICGSGMAQYQLPNSDFEEGFVVGFKGKNIYTGTKTVTTTEPLNWHGFPTLNGKSLITGPGRIQGDKLCESDDIRPGSEGTKSVYIKTTYVGAMGITKLANGVMTSGRVNSSSPTPDDPANNYNYSPGGIYKQNNNKNTNFNPEFTGKPDAMRVWVKFVANDATQKSKYPYASVNAVLHNSNKYQDPEVEGNDYSNIKIAGASDLEIGKSGYNKWTELTLPFKYYHTAEEDEPANMLVSFSTNTQPGEGTDGDMLFIDDLEFIYNSELKTATYDKESLNFSTSNQINIDKVYDPTLLEVTSNGEGATISRNYDAATGLLTITIKGNDISENENNYHTYKIQFAKPKTSKKYDAGLIVTVDETVYPEQKSSINIYEMPNDTYMMQLSNFILGGGMPVGNIVLTGLMADASKIGMMSFASTQTIQISEGTDETYAGVWIGPSLGDVPVEFAGKMTDKRFFCNIDINMPEPLNQQIKVVFGKDFTVVNEQQPVSADEVGTKDVILNRSFAQGWNTVCLPFNVNPAEITEGAKAQAFAGVNNNALNFTEVTEMQANTPYLFFAPQAVESGKVLEYKEVVAGEANSVTHGEYTFCGTYTNTDMLGKYGVADINGVQKIMRGAAGSSLAGTRAYFTTTLTNANGMRICFDGNEVTGINNINVENTNDTTAIYNLHGVKVSNHGTSKLPAGLYIIQGKKVIVK